MAVTEKRYLAVLPIPFVANGTVDGLVTISSTSGLRTKQIITLTSSAAGGNQFEIKRVLSKTQLRVGPVGGRIDVYSDISAYLATDGSTIQASEQPRPAIPDKEYERAVYEEEPVVAKRVYLVDALGQGFDENNPLPVEATVSDNAPQNCFMFRNDYSVAGTEQSQIIPNNTKKLYIAVVGLGAKLRVSFDANGTIDGGSETYTTVEYGNSYDREGLKLIGKTLYYSVNKADQIVEIEAWV